MEEKLTRFKERFGLPGSVLKIIAIVTMFCDHAGAAVVPLLYRYFPSLDRQMMVNLAHIMRRLVRLAFPIFCFLLVEGFLHTRNVRKYALRLFIFALISEPCFDYCLHHGQPFWAKQNVYFTLLIGILVLWAIREFNGQVAMQLIVMSAGLILAKLLRTDYSYKGVFVIEMLYITRFSPLYQSLCGAAFFEMYEKMPTPLAFIPVWLYNGKRGRQMKYFYYCFYPAHLLLLGLIAHEILPRMFPL